MTTRREYAQIDERAYSLRELGASWEDVASAIGYSVSTAQACYRRHAIRLGVLPARSPRATSTRRTFGVEIEFVNCPRRDIAEAVERVVGSHVLLTGYHGRTCECCGMRYRRGMWKVERDGSVSSGGEVVSPILKTENDIETLKAVVRAMREAGAEVNSAAGLHVHIGVSDMTNSGRAEVIRLWDRMQTTMDRFVAPSRRGQNNHFCRRPSTDEINRWATHFENGGDGRNLHADRYRSLNVTSYVKYGTFEVRQHQGTLNARKVEAWVRLLLGLFNSAHANQSTTIADGLAMLGSLSDANRLPQATAAYLTSRASTLARR